MERPPFDAIDVEAVTLCREHAPDCALRSMTLWQKFLLRFDEPNSGCTCGLVAAINAVHPPPADWFTDPESKNQSR